MPIAENPAGASSAAPGGGATGIRQDVLYPRTKVLIQNVVQAGIPAACVFPEGTDSLDDFKDIVLIGEMEGPNQRFYMDSRVVPASVITSAALPSPITFSARPHSETGRAAEGVDRWVVDIDRDGNVTIGTSELDAGESGFLTIFGRRWGEGTVPRMPAPPAAAAHPKAYHIIVGTDGVVRWVESIAQDVRRPTVRAGTSPDFVPEAAELNIMGQQDRYGTWFNLPASPDNGRVVLIAVRATDPDISAIYYYDLYQNELSAFDRHPGTVTVVENGVNVEYKVWRSRNALTQQNDLRVYVR